MCNAFTEKTKTCLRANKNRNHWEVDVCCVQGLQNQIKSKELKNKTKKDSKFCM